MSSAHLQASPAQLPFTFAAPPLPHAPSPCSAASGGAVVTPTEEMEVEGADAAPPAAPVLGGFKCTGELEFNTACGVPAVVFDLAVVRFLF